MQASGEGCTRFLPSWEVAAALTTRSTLTGETSRSVPPSCSPARRREGARAVRNARIDQNRPVPGTRAPHTPRQEPKQPDAGRSSRSTSGGLRPAALSRPARSRPSLSMSTRHPRPARPPPPSTNMIVARATEERNTTEPARFNDLRWMPTHCAGIEEWLNPGGGREGRRRRRRKKWRAASPDKDVLYFLSGIPCPVSLFPSMASSLFNYYSSHAHYMSTMSFFQYHVVIQAHLYVRGGVCRSRAGGGGEGGVPALNMEGFPLCRSQKRTRLGGRGPAAGCLRRRRPCMGLFRAGRAFTGLGAAGSWGREGLVAFVA